MTAIYLRPADVRGAYHGSGQEQEAGMGMDCLKDQTEGSIWSRDADGADAAAQ